MKRFEFVFCFAVILPSLICGYLVPKELVDMSEELYALNKTPYFLQIHTPDGKPIIKGPFDQRVRFDKGRHFVYYLAPLMSGRHGIIRVFLTLNKVYEHEMKNNVRVLVGNAWKSHVTGKKYKFAVWKFGNE